MTPIYAIGDIHGHLDKLEDALDKIERDGGPDAQIVFLGDLVDRGLDSQGVIELLRAGMAAGRNWTAVRGNHDRMFSYFLEDQPRSDPCLRYDLFWLHQRLGGDTTLASYGVDIAQGARLGEIHAAARATVPQSHVAFLRTLQPYHQVGDLLFVHAGIRPEVALADQNPDDLSWIRDPFLSYAKPHPYLVVHGHTAVSAPEHCGNRVNLDSGAGHGRALTTAVFEGQACWVLSDQGRDALIAP